MMNRAQPRCIWSHADRPDLITIRVATPNPFASAVEEREVLVSPEYETQVRSFFSRERQYGRVFIALMCVAAVLGVVAALAGQPDGSSAVLLGIGILLVLLPFSTPRTIELLGIRGAVRLARATGTVFIAAGTLLLLV
jgi:hypothetical protein